MCVDRDCSTSFIQYVGGQSEESWFSHTAGQNQIHISNLINQLWQIRGRASVIGCIRVLEHV